MASSLPSNPSSVFSATTTKPALGTSFTFTTDICLLLQETGRVFGLVDEQERERSRKQAGLRAVVEVLKSRVSVGLSSRTRNRVGLIWMTAFGNLDSLRDGQLLFSLRITNSS